jgi:glycosyltransferase involved in cell wall biosynthesis
MRIVLVHENDAWGGTENYLSGLARALAEGGGGDEVHIVAPEAWLARWREASGASVHLSALPGGLIGRARLLGRLAPDVLHVNDPQPKTLLAGRLAGVGLSVTTYHTPSLNIQYNRTGRIFWRAGARWPRSHFVVLSAQNRKQLAARTRIPLERIHVVPLGIGEQRFQGIPGRSEARRALDLPPDAFVAICAGRLEPQKAHEVLLEAYARALPALPQPSVLLIAGSGSRMEELQTMAREMELSDSVRFLGYVRSMPETIRAADVNVLSSDFEGLPAVILEAMALGVPTVSTSVDGMRDLIVPGEGLLVPPRDPAALASALAAVAQDPAGARAMGEAARRKFAESHTEVAMVTQMRALYERLLDPAGA